MDRFPLRQFLKIAFVTSPLISFITTAPVVIVSDLPLNKCLLVFTVVSLLIFIIWLANLALIYFTKKDWALKWYRIFIVSVAVTIPGYMITSFVKPETFLTINQFGFVRLVNIICVNAIIYIIVDIILAKGRERELDSENIRLKMDNIEAQYKLLKDQINPHFLFNALGTTKALIQQQPNLAEEYIVRLSEFLRINFEDFQEMTSVQEELTRCRNYLALQNLKLQEKLQSDFDLTEEILKLHIPYFSLVTLTENAIKHFAFSSGKPLMIRISYADGYLLFSNNIQERNFQELASTKTGLKNLNKRSLLLTGKEIHIIKNSAEFCVKLKAENLQPYSKSCIFKKTKSITLENPDHRGRSSYRT